MTGREQQYKVSVLDENVLRQMGQRLMGRVVAIGLQLALVVLTLFVVENDGFGGRVVNLQDLRRLS